MTTPAFFTRTETGYLPTELPLSPWNPGTLNGVAIAGLLAHLLDEAAATEASPMQFARLTIDLLGTAPCVELEPSVTVMRDGARMRILNAELKAGGRAIARVQALRVRTADTPVCETALGAPPPEAFVAEPPQALSVLRHTERRVVAGRDREAGPGTLWVRFDYEIVAGVPLSPLVRTAMLADYAGGTGNMLVPESYSWPNLDVTIYLMREPVGEWLMIEAMTESAGNGVGVASARIADRDGSVARTHQTIYVERSEVPAHAAGRR